MLTSEIFKNFIDCSYKSYLIFSGNCGDKDALEFYFEKRNLIYGDRFQQKTSSKYPPATNGKNGNSWFPIEFSESNKIESTIKLRLAYQVLEKRISEKIMPKYGEIIFGNNFSKKRISLKKPLALCKKNIGEINKIYNESLVPDFSLNAHCRICRFQNFCQKKAIDANDLSLISGLSRKERLKLNKRGIFTITQLGHSFSPQRRRMKVNTKHLPALKALAIKDQKIYVNQPPDIHKETVRLYLDVEDVFNRELYYLIGLKVINANEEKSYSWWADAKIDEKSIWYKFLETVLSFDRFSLFHYGAYETEFIKKMFKTYEGCTDDEFKKILNSCVNVLTFCHLNIYFPTFTNGLKDVATYIKFIWKSPITSGLASIMWRLNWEESSNEQLKQNLIDYNMDDCDALRMLVDTIFDIFSNANSKSIPVVRADKIKRSHQYRWGRNTFSSSDFSVVNNCAYFDYQSSKVYWRTDKDLKRKLQQRRKEENRKISANHYIIFSRPQVCPHCSSTRINVHDKINRTVFDLKLTSTGIRRWIINGSGNRYKCLVCNKVVYPPDYFKSSFKYGRNLMAWVVYMSIGLKVPHESILNFLNDVFGFRFKNDFVTKFKTFFAELYEDTFHEIKKNIQSSHFVHVDETKISIRGAMGYVWVFSNFKNVLYLYSDSRESKILQDTLKGFNGVLISDFFAAYDSMECPQQRCLIHLVRDINDDFLKHQFDLEFKLLVQNFGQLLRSIIETVDKRGLKAYFLKKHERDVNRFYNKFISKDSNSEMVQKYQTKFKKNRQRLFTFLKFDGVPWNNNGAENAIKGFATFRALVGGLSTEVSIKDSLILLSIAQTLKNNDASLLKFLVSEEKSINQYLNTSGSSSLLFKRFRKKAFVNT